MASTDFLDSPEAPELDRNSRFSVWSYLAWLGANDRQELARVLDHAAFADITSPLPEEAVTSDVQ